MSGRAWLLTGLAGLWLTGCASLSPPADSWEGRPVQPTSRSMAGQPTTDGQGDAEVLTGRFLLAGDRLSAPIQGRYEWGGRAIWLADPAGRPVGGFIRAPADEASIAGWTLADARGQSIDRPRAEVWAQQVLGLSPDALEDLGLLLNDVHGRLLAQSDPSPLARQARGLVLRLVPDRRP